MNEAELEMTPEDEKTQGTGSKSRLLDEASERARTGLEQARQKANGVISKTREKSGAVIEDTREKGYRAAAETNRLFQEHPIAAVAAAAAAGAVIGIFVPRIVLAGKASKVAGRAMKAAAASDTAHKIWSNVRAAGKSARAARAERKQALPDESTASDEAVPEPPATEGPPADA